MVKPEAQEAIKASADNQVESIKDTPHATTDELDEANQQINDTLKQGQQDMTIRHKMQLSMMLETKRLRQSNKLNRKLDANVQRWITLMKVIIINSMQYEIR